MRIPFFGLLLLVCFSSTPLFSQEDVIDTLLKIEQERTQNEKAIQTKYAENCETMFAKQIEMLADSRKTLVDAGNLDGVLAVQKMTEAVKEAQILIEVEIALPPWKQESEAAPENVVAFRKTTQESLEKELQETSEKMFRSELDELDKMIRELTKQEKINEAIAVKKIRDAAQKDFEQYQKTPNCPFGWKTQIKLFPKEKNIEIFDGSQAALRDEKLQAMQAESSGPQARLGCNDWTEAGVMNAEGTLLLTGSNINDCTARLFDIETQKVLVEIPCDGPVMDTAFHPTLPLLLSVDTTPTIHVWNATSFEKHADFSPMPHCNVMRIAIHKDGEYAIAGSDKGRVFAWNTENGKLLQEFEEGHTEEIRDIAFHPNGKMFATASVDSNVCFWTMESDKPIRKIEHAANGDLFCVRFSPEGTKIAVTSKWGDQYVLIYDVQTGELVNNFGAYGHRMRSANFSPDGRFLVTGDVDHRVVIWDIEKKAPLWSDARNAGNHIYRVLFTPDQKSLIVVAGFAPTIYNLPESFHLQEPPKEQ